MNIGGDGENPKGNSPKPCHIHYGFHCPANHCAGFRQSQSTKMTVYYQGVFSRPEPDEEIPARQRKLADVIVDTDTKSISLMTPNNEVLYTATWEVWALQMLIHSF